MSARRFDGPGAGRVRIVGPGRVGGAFTRLFGGLGWHVLEAIGRTDDPSAAAHGTDLVVIATPDAAVAATAAAIEPVDDALVMHVAGALGLDVLDGHPRRGSLHPLVAIPDAAVGATRLAAGAWFAVAADTGDDRALLGSIVAAVDGQVIEVADADRAAYHAAAAVASNHLVALVGQVERIAAPIGVPLEAFLALASQTLAGMETTTPADALTGPVRRGDWATVARHLEALDAAERPGYAAMAEGAARLVPDADEPPAWLAAARRGDEPSRSDTGGET